ncbi:MAG: aminodeoxychorismate/anthranilate synthase component II [Salinivirgaceae bacterium]|nr:aminodeoxychorismate/anthranilate synthase component II [Salinivirgaceae bacterium]
MRILIIDNNDSFTYNLLELLRKTNLCTVDVILLEEITSKHNFESFQGIIVSPGPGLPVEKNGLFDVIRAIEGKIPLLGVCLGHQAIAQYFGASIYQLDRIIHGESSAITKLNDDLLYRNLKDSFQVGRYHSWAISMNNFPKELKATSETDSGILMSFKHQTKNICGLQFHPESILTPQGNKIIENWLINYVKNHSK